MCTYKTNNEQTETKFCRWSVSFGSPENEISQKTLLIEAYSPDFCTEKQN